MLGSVHRVCYLISLDLMALVCWGAEEGMGWLSLQLVSGRDSKCRQRASHEQGIKASRPSGKRLPRATLARTGGGNARKMKNGIWRSKDSESSILFFNLWRIFAITKNRKLSWAALHFTFLWPHSEVRDMQIHPMHLKNTSRSDKNKEHLHVMAHGWELWLLRMKMIWAFIAKWQAEHRSECQCSVTLMSNWLGCSVKSL